MPIKKRFRAIQLGRDLYLHPKTYKRLIRLSRRCKDLRPVLAKIKVRYSLPPLTMGFSLDDINRKVRFDEYKKARGDE